jgi:hypothetical protein
MTQDEAEQRIIDGRVWTDFCRALERAGDAVLRPTTPATALDRAEGWRYLTRLLRAALESQLEYGNPSYPGLYQLSNETVKIGNDNPDNFYQNSTISGRHEYRITGTRGTVHYLSLGTKAGGYGSDGTLRPTGQLEGSELELGPGGALEIRLSCKPQPGNWLPMQPDTSMLIVRQTFHDRAREEPARLRIECLDPEGSPALDPAGFEQSLQRAAAFVRGTANKFVDWMNRYSAHRNQLPSDDQAECQRSGGDAKIHYLQSYWKLEPDEALVVEARKIPRCQSWNLQLSNYWMESLDYRYHRIHLNKHTAHYEPDGSVRIAIAHRDPGPRWPNWLTTDGHAEGGMLFRWIDADEHPPVATRVVPFAELAKI